MTVDAKTGVAIPLAPGGRVAPPQSPFPAMLGMKVDSAARRLWIAGGFTGRVTVVDLNNGRVIKQLKAPTTPKTLLNDLVVVGSSVYVTDTFVPTLWRASMTSDALEPWLDLSGGPIAFADGPNLNGIAATADGKTLIVGQMNKGRLFKIDVASKAVTALDVGGADLTGVDGLWLDGRTLFVVRQWAGEIVTIALDADLTRGACVRCSRTPRSPIPQLPLGSGRR